MIIAIIFTVFSATQLSAQCQLNVEDEVSISVNENCEALLTKKMFLTDDGLACQAARAVNGGYYMFEVRSADGLDVIVPISRPVVLDETIVDFGVLYMVIIEAYDSGNNLLNTGMSTFYLFDKMPPTFDCPEYPMEVACWQDDATILPAIDNCSNASFVWTDEVVTSNDCSTGIDGLNWPWFRLKQIERTYVAVDASGNHSAPCSVTLNVNAFDFGPLYAYMWGVRNFENVAGTAISCKDADLYKDAEGNFDPDKTGWPNLIHEDEYPTLAEQQAGDLFDTLVIDNNCNFDCNLAATYIDIEVNTCPNCVEKVLRLWTVVETSCLHPERIVHIDAQHIEVYDEIDPVIVCPDDITITTNTVGNFEPTSAGDLDCGAMFTFPVPEMSDECHSSVTWTISVQNDLGGLVAFADTNETKSPVFRALPYGTNTVEYIVYDGCGNNSSCTWYVYVVDNTPPVAVCQQYTTASLTYDGEAEIPANVFNSGSYDDCKIDHFEVRRMDNQIDCEGSTDDLFHPYVRFCCDDVDPLQPITVIMRAFDRQGNHNECMVQVTVQDKLPPSITCPPSVCVECEYPFVIDSLDKHFGTIVEGYENRGENTIFGSFGSFYDTYSDRCGEGSTNFAFKDGWAHDNCGLDMDSDYNDYRNQCGEGNIERTFIVSDPNGSVSCTQTIHFYNPDPFNIDDITWPLDMTMTACANAAEYGPDVTGRPILVEDNCDLVASNYEDLVFHFNDDNNNAENTCFKIIRRWTVMDWCQQYSGDYMNQSLAGTYYTWHFDQVIMINEFEAPTFTSDCEDKETCTYDVECQTGYIELSMSAEDGCTDLEDLKWRYQIDYDNDGSFDKDSKDFLNPIISGSEANASGNYPIGKHRIVWSVWDQCGNVTVCDKFFTVNNCKKPTPICIDHINIEMMPVDNDNDGIADWAMIEVGADLVEACCAKSYHPCGYPLSYAFSSDITDTHRTYDCDTKGLQDVEMWVFALLPDGTYTTDYCRTQIDFQDNNNACPSSLVNVSGAITTINEDPIPNVNVELQGSELTAVNTSDNGTFAFVTGSDKNYIVAPSKDSNPLNGVTTLDLVIIQKHLLGLNSIDNPYLLLAIFGTFIASIGQILLKYGAIHTKNKSIFLSFYNIYTVSGYFLFGIVSGN